MAYEFHYTPTGTGVISGKEVLEQTEDAINDLGNTAISGVQEALDKAEQALTNSENAVDDAQTALNTANNAEGVAIQAQTDVSNLSGTVTNIGNRVTTAEGNITNLQGRMTTAEGNITNLQGRMTTAEGNIGNLQTAVSTAQATANSAQQTATTARQQSYVFRYSSTALVASSTNANSLLDNTDNLKVGDKVMDTAGVLFEVTAIDTANSTFTIGTALIDLAQDSDVVHTSGDETVGGKKELSEITTFAGSSLGNEGSNNARTCIYSYCNRDTKDYSGIYQRRIRQNREQGSMSGSDISQYAFDVLENQVRTNNIIYFVARDFVDDVPQTVYLTSQCTNRTLGSSNYPWSAIYGNAYYYGNIEFSTKFVTTDTNQTISGNKTFSSINGVEPSSLSLPSGNVNDFIDISSYFSNTGSGGRNSYTAPANGWIYLRLGNIGGCQADVFDANNNRMWGQSSTGSVEQMTIPILKGQTLLTQWNTSSTVYVDTAHFIPCQGNV